MGHLKAEGEGELSNLRLVLVGFQIKQVKIESSNNLVISVMKSNLIGGLVEEGVFRSN